MTDNIVVLCTCGSQEEADRLADLLVGKRLAACVTLIPGVQSVYRWKGAIERSREFLLMIKTSQKCFKQMNAELAKAHSYDVPEVIALPIVDGSAAYLEWIAESLENVT